MQAASLIGSRGNPIVSLIVARIVFSLCFFEDQMQRFHCKCNQQKNIASTLYILLYSLTERTKCSSVGLIKTKCEKKSKDTETKVIIVIKIRVLPLDLK